jgi:hypothetical protein
VIEVLSPDDAGEMLTLQRSAYVDEALLYGEFLPPLKETLVDVQGVIETATLARLQNPQSMGILRASAVGPDQRDSITRPGGTVSAPALVCNRCTVDVRITPPVG